MKKNDLLEQLSKYGFTEDVLKAVQQELSAYPEEMTSDDAKKFDSFLQDLQASEIEESHNINQLADFLEQAVEQTDNEVDGFARNTMRAMKTTLSHAQDLVEMSEQ